MGNSVPDHEGPSAVPASLFELFRMFNRLALHGFGGVLPWAQRVLVEERRWLTREEFVEMLAFAQLAPGPNVCNLAIMFGDRHFGWRGALVALAAMLAVPGALVLALAIVHGQLAQIPWVQRAVAGMAAVAAGLLIATAVKLARTQSARWLVLGALAFFGVGLLRWPFVTVLAVLVPLAIALGWRASGGAASPEPPR
jgi:chromate transporter